MAGVNLTTLHPDAYQAVIALNETVSRAAAAAGLEQRTIELVKIRVSQLNGCAYCLRMHTRDAIEHGETSDRLAVLPAWWESQYFTDVERAALALAEDVTQIGEPSRDERGNGGHGIDALSDEQISAVSWLAIVMNTWNRIAVRSHYPVAP